MALDDIEDDDDMLLRRATSRRRLLSLGSIRESRRGADANHVKKRLRVKSKVFQAYAQGIISIWVKHVKMACFLKARVWVNQDTFNAA